MDLISREAIHEKEITNPENDYEYGWNEALAETDADIPSAFEGMTNGEVIRAVFPNASVYQHGSTYSVNNEYNFNSTWWNLPYQKGDTEDEKV